MNPLGLELNQQNVDTIHHTEINPDPQGHLAKDGLHPTFQGGVWLIAENIKYRLRNSFRVTLPTTRIIIPFAAGTEQMNQPDIRNRGNYHVQPRRTHAKGAHKR